MPGSNGCSRSLIIDACMRHRLGRRSEQLDAEQFALALEDIEGALAQWRVAVSVLRVSGGVFSAVQP